MRVIIILAAIAFTHGAKLEKTYLPPSNARSAGGSANFLETPLSGASGANSPRNYNAQSGFSQTGNGNSQFGNELPQSGNGFFQNDRAIQAQYGDVSNYANEARPERPRASFERNAAILRQDSANDGETFSYTFETENGIYAEESGVATNGVEAQGGFSYTGDDGQVYSIRYSAGKDGFIPQGDHIPTPPPVPEEILKALEQNARDEAAGIYDDGSYNEGKYAAADNTNYNNQFNYQQNNAFNGNDDDTVVTNSALTRSGNNAFGNGHYNANNGAVAPTYGAPNVPNAPTFNAANPVYGAPAANNGLNFNIAQRNVQPFNAAAGSNTPSFNSGANVAIPRNSPEKAYLPPLTEREQTRNAFGRRQQSFNARTGYQY